MGKTYNSFSEISEYKNNKYNHQDETTEIKNILSNQQIMILELQDNYNFIIPKLETSLNETLLENSELKFKLDNQEKAMAKMKQKIYQLTKVIESHQIETKQKYESIEDSIMDLDLDVDEIKSSLKKK